MTAFQSYQCRRIQLSLIKLFMQAVVLYQPNLNYQVMAKIEKYSDYL